MNMALQLFPYRIGMCEPHLILLKKQTSKHILMKAKTMQHANLGHIEGHLGVQKLNKSTKCIIG